VAVAAVPAAVIGAASAAAILAARGVIQDVPIPGWTLGWTLAAVISVLAVLTFGGIAGRAAQDPGRESGHGAGTGRLRARIRIGVVALVSLAAVLAVSQFLLYGSPLVPTAEGGVAVDPVAVSAPALGMAASCLLLLSAFPLAARGLERAAIGLRGMRALPLRQLARRSPAALSSILVLAFAVSGLVFAASYSGTWSAGAGETRAVKIGTDVRVTSSDALPGDIARLHTGASAAAPAYAASGQIGDTGVNVIALPSEQFADVITPVAGAVDPETLSRSVPAGEDRPAIPDGATELVVTAFPTPAAAAPLGILVIVSNDVGTMLELPTIPSTVGYTAALPPGSTGWRVRALRIELPFLDEGAEVTFALRASGGSEAVIPTDGNWSVIPGPLALPFEQDDVAELDEGGLGMRAAVASEGGSFLLQPTAPDRGRLPIVISQGAADSAGIEVGAKPDLTIVALGRLPATVVAISPVTPGSASGEGILVDLDALQDAALREDLGPVAANQLWIATDDPAGASAALSDRVPVGSLVETRAPVAADLVLGSARVAVWIAAAATGILALLAVAAGMLTELTSRRAQVGVLRSMGVRPREQGRGRVLEWTVLLGLALLAGLIAGTVVSTLVVGALARVAVPNAIAGLRTPFRIDGAEGGLALLVLGLALCGLLLATAIAVGRQAGAPLPRELDR